MAQNEFEAAAREKKALALARRIYREMLECVERMTVEDWAQLAEAAGVNPPHGPETVEMVKEILKGRGPKE